MVSASWILPGSSVPPISNGHGLDERSLGKPADAGAHRLLRAGDDLVGDRTQIIEPVIAGDADEASVPTQPAATWARISPMTFSLKRTLRVRMASRSSFGSPAPVQAHQGNNQTFLEHLLAEASSPCGRQYPT